MAAKRYGSDDIAGIRDEMIIIRNEALKQNSFEWAVTLSHNIAILAQYLDDIANGCTLNELE